MMSAEREPVTGVWGQSPSELHGQRSGEGLKPPEAESF